MCKKVFLLGLLLCSIYSYAQSTNELLAFKLNAIDSIGSGASPASGGSVISGVKVNYLGALANVYASGKSHIDNYSVASYFDDLSQTISFLGDYKSVLECLQLGNSLPDKNLSKSIESLIAEYKGAYTVDAQKIILALSKTKRVVMINEAHCKPLHRAFMYALLDEFYQLGFKYLAMETMNHPPYGELQKLTSQTGYYTCEPVGGELIRKALKIGFKLIPYEDTSKTSNSRQRDSAQAMHLYEVIKKDPDAKMLVFAGYGHIEKVKSSDEFVPMAYQFKQFSQIDPLSIDQTSVSEKGNDAFSNLYYELLLEKYPVKTPSILLKGDSPVMLLPDEGRYDVRIIHPPSTYYKGRATWYRLDNERKPTEIKLLPKNAFLVQAYYLDEWKENMEDSIIPADQTYLKYNNKAMVLFLRKGRYRIVFRDMQNKILRTKTISIQ